MCTALDKKMVTLLGRTFHHCRAVYTGWAKAAEGSSSMACLNCPELKAVKGGSEIRSEATKTSLSADLSLNTAKHICVQSPSSALSSSPSKHPPLLYGCRNYPK